MLVVLALAVAVTPRPASAGFGGRISGFGGGSRTSGGGWGGGGGWSSGFAKPAKGTPVGGTVTGTPAFGATGSGSFRPAPGAALPTMPVKYGSAAAVGGGAAGGLAGMASSGYRRGGSSLLPFGMGLFAGTAAYSLLSSNPNAKCDGRTPQCYRDTCAAAAKLCDAAGSKPLSLTKCPDTSSIGRPFTECWATSDKSFLCLGRPRPTAEDAYETLCNANAKGANGTAGNLTDAAVLAALSSPGDSPAAAGGRGGGGALAAAVAGAAVMVLVLL